MKQQSELRKVFRAVHNALQELEGMTPSKRKKTILSLMEINMELEEKIIEHLNKSNERVSEDSPVHC
jgi:mevalonate kinase